ncbi:hypothetical protein EO087_00035 [Dyella sp. M7H15-1]|uniref:hypothetical protein n=1 Tax=Dyella sp. M7H15-1 TaxID=2501295 RepID=UPI001004F300|nr:hypothetical protein [Dyella sp. M7H15-1]QAU22558.1 hypothetical protein EO087_00035 [Dyella sp. M7H15-1]
MNALLHLITRTNHRPESCRSLNNDERRGLWAARFYGEGHHQRQQKPRIRVTVPQPLITKDTRK